MYQLANTSTLSGMDEGTLAELQNGDVIANMRNKAYHDTLHFAVLSLTELLCRTTLGLSRAVTTVLNTIVQASPCRTLTLMLNTIACPYISGLCFAGGATWSNVHHDTLLSDPVISLTIEN